MSDEYTPHDNSGWPPGMTPDSWVKCLMADGTTISAAQAKDIDWQHDEDPVVGYSVVRFVPMMVH